MPEELEEITRQLTRNHIIQWFEKGKQQGKAHMIIVDDRYDLDYYPVYVEQGKSLEKEQKKITDNEWDRIYKTYDLNKDVESQL